MFPTIRRGSSKPIIQESKLSGLDEVLFFSNCTFFFFFSSQDSDLKNSTGVEFLLQCSINDVMIMSTHKSHPL